MQERLDQHDTVEKRQLVAPTYRAARAANDLHEAKAPAAALRDVFLEALGSEAERELLVEIDSRKPDFLQPQGQQIVFRHRVGREAADTHQGREADNRRRTAAKRAAPGVLGWHDDIEEEALLVRPNARDGKVRLDRVGIEKVLGRLHHANVGILHQRERALEKMRGDDEVRVENANKIRLLGQGGQAAQRIVDVARLGVRIV